MVDTRFLIGFSGAHDGGGRRSVKVFRSFLRIMETDGVLADDGPTSADMIFGVGYGPTRAIAKGRKMAGAMFGATQQ